MHTSQLSSFVLAVMLLCTTASAQHSELTDPASSNSAISEKLKLSPSQLSTTSTFRFTENRGQLADQYGKPMPEVKYYGESKGVKFYFTQMGFHYVFTQTISNQDQQTNLIKSEANRFAMPEVDSIKFHRVDLAFVGANHNPKIIASNKTTDYTNYYLAHCPNGITNVASFERVTYKDLYKNIDMVLYSTEQGMKYDFIVRPGGDPRSIKIAVAGADSTYLNDHRLTIATALGAVTDETPYSFQKNIDKTEHVIASKYSLTGNTLTFDLGAYDTKKLLVIDPPRIWGTYYGGTVTIMATEVDRQDNIFLAGYTKSSSNIATSSAFQSTIAGETDGFVVKFNKLGQRLWATYYGGTSDDYFRRLATSPQGNVIVAGHSASNGLATVSAYQSTKDSGASGLIVSLSSNGTRNWCTYFGGRPFADVQTDAILGLAVDSSSEIYITGITSSDSGISSQNTFFNFSNNGTNSGTGFFARFSPGGARRWSEYLYGTNEIGKLELIGLDIVADRNSIVYLAGVTLAYEGVGTSGTFIPERGLDYFDNCILSFNSDGGKRWGTYAFGPYTSSSYFATSLYNLDYVGLSVNDHSLFYSCELISDQDSASIVSTVGAYQTALGGQLDGSLSRFSKDGRMIWSTYFGGEEEDGVLGITSNNESVYIAGYSRSSDDIATPNEFKTVGQSMEGFLARFDTAGIRKWATYYGGSAADQSHDVAVMSTGYVVIGGATGSNTGIATIGSYQPSRGTSTGFVALFCDTAYVPITSLLDSSICEGESLKLFAKEGYSAYQWKRNGVNVIGATLSSYETPKDLAPGLHRYTVNIADPFLCAAVSDTFNVLVFEAPKVNAGTDDTICRGTALDLKPSISGGKSTYLYEWTPSTGLDDAKKRNPRALPQTSTKYVLTVTDSNLCTSFDTVSIVVNELPIPVITGKTAICPGEKATLTVQQDFKSYFWSTGEYTRSIQATKKGAYWVESMDSNGCVGHSALFLLNVYDLPTVTIDGPNSACPNTTDTYSGQEQPQSTYTWTLVPAAGASISSGQGTSSIKINWQTAGSYQLKLAIKSQEGCENDTTITVVVSDKLTPVIAITGSIPFCTGDSVILTAPSGYQTYLWSPSGETTRSIIVKSAGDYSVAVTSAGGCSGSSGITKVIVNDDEIPKPEIRLSKSVLCEGDSVQLSTSVPNSSYLWSTGETSSTITVKAAGEYSVIVSNAAGCKGSSKDITIRVEPRPVAQITVQSATAFCTGDSVTLEATPGYNYDWLKDGVSIGIATQSLTVGQSGSYSVNVSNNAGCSVTTNIISVNVKPSPVLSIAGAMSLCNNAKASYSVTGATGATISWEILPASLGAITSGQGTATITVQWNTSATGTLRVTANLNGCIAEKELPITLDDKLVPTITPNGPLEFCDGSSVNLDAGSGYSSYRWTKDAVEVATTQVITVTTGGLYQVRVTSSDGCEGSASVNTRVFPLPAKPIITQVGNDLVSTTATTYWWTMDNAEIVDGTNQTQRIIGNGIYRVTITDENGCENTSDPYIIGNASAHVALPRWISGEAGKQIDVPLELVSSNLLTESGASEYVARIKYNPALLSPKDLNGVSQGNWNVITATGAATNVAEILQTLRFTGLVDAKLCDDIVIDTFYFVDADVAVTTESGYACVSNICAPGISTGDMLNGNSIWLGLPRPNPATNSADVTFEIAEAGIVRLELHNSSGANTQVLFDQFVQAGFYQRHVDLSSTASGSYHLVLVKDRQTRSTPLVVSK